MTLSYLIITYNRRDGLLHNLRQLFANDPLADVWVVDNASTDGTPAAVSQAFPNVRLIVLDENLGMPARNVALRDMSSEFVAIIDDDSYPLGDAVQRSVEHMKRNPDVAAVVGRAELPGGKSEASALPALLLGCASCVRLSAVKEVGYFPPDFFRQAEEFDLSCRLWNAGYRVVRFENLVYRHDKTPSASRASRTVTALDLKHNLIIAARYLPTRLYEAYREDFIARYGAMMRYAGHGADVASVIHEADGVIVDARRLRRSPITARAIESIFEFRRQREAITTWAGATGVQRVVLVDYSKNLFATYQACIDARVEVRAVVDDRPGFAGLQYRGVPIVGYDAASLSAGEGAIVSNINPAQVDDVASAARTRFGGAPLLTLWQPATLAPATLQKPSSSLAA